MNSKVGSLEEKVKLPPTETISRCYQPQGNRKVIRILTVAVYVLCVSLAAIMLSLYYIFIWDPSIRPFATKSNNCDKIVIPEKIAIRLLNSSEVTAEAFYKHILEQYRILNHLQQQRQLFLQKQQLQLQQLTAANKFQEVFATATIIQANRNDQYKRVMATANGTLLLQPRPPILALEQQQQQQQQQKQDQQQQEQEQRLQLQQQQEQLQQQLQLQERQQQQQLQLQLQQQMAPILDTTATHIKRKSHRKHYSNHHRHNTRKSHRKPLQPNNNQETAEQQHQQQQQQTFIENSDIIMEPATSVMEQNYTPIPIPLILNTREEKRPHHHEHSAKLSPSYSSSSSLSSSMQPRRRTTLATSIYDRPSYMNPFLTGELIFEK